MQSLEGDLERNCDLLKSSVNVRVIEGKFGINKLSKELSVSPDAFMQVSSSSLNQSPNVWLQPQQKPKRLASAPATATPSLFVQMCIQCAWFRVHGKPTAT